jgi:hypothetical protein
MALMVVLAISGPVIMVRDRLAGRAATPSAAEGAQPAAAAAGGGTVRMAGLAFAPGTLTVARGRHRRLRLLLHHPPDHGRQDRRDRLTRRRSGPHRAPQRPDRRAAAALGGGPGADVSAFVLAAATLWTAPPSLRRVGLRSPTGGLGTGRVGAARPVGGCGVRGCGTPVVGLCGEPRGPEGVRGPGAEPACQVSAWGPRASTTTVPGGWMGPEPPPGDGADGRHCGPWRRSTNRAWAEWPMGPCSSWMVVSARPMPAAAVVVDSRATHSPAGGRKR